MTTATPSGVLVSIPEIAQIAGVGRSAVGNWRKRHPDFPPPAVMAPSGALFDLAAVEAWLVENDKISGRVSSIHRLWAMADAARGSWRPEDIFSFLVSALLYFDALERNEDLPPNVGWGEVTAADNQFAASLRQAYSTIEDLVPELEGLLLPGLERVDAQTESVARGLMEVLAGWNDPEVRPFEIFEEAAQRLVQADRFWGEHSTPDGISYLIARLADVEGGTILDLAAGQGGLLLMTAVIQTDQHGPLNLVGIERTVSVARLARARIYLYDLDDVTTEIVVGDALATPPQELPEADYVVLDPPYGQRDWAKADVYLGDRWRFGGPSPRSADLAWVQQAVMTLKPDGRGFVVLPAGTLTRSGREAEVRKNLIRSGALEGIVLLPSGLRSDTSIQLAVWLLRSPEQSLVPPDLLLIDAAQAGEHGRGTTTLDESDIDQIVEIERSWRTNGSFSSTPLVSAIVASIEDLSEGNLDPRHHQPRPTIDRKELTHQVLSLREELGLSSLEGSPLSPAPTTSLSLGDVVRVDRGGPITVTEDPNGQPVLGAREINGTGRRYVTDRSSARLRTVLPGDVVLVMDARGGSCIVTPDQADWALAPECAALRVIATEYLTPEWLHLWLCSSDYQAQFDRHVSGTTVPRLHAGSLRDFTIPVPSLDVQQAATQRMSAVEDAIIEATRRLRQLEELRRAETDLLVAMAENRDE